VPVVAAMMAAAVVRALGPSLRLRVIGLDAVLPAWDARRPLIYALWHGRLLMIPWLSARLTATHGGRNIRVLASHSRDGEIVAGFVRSFGLQTIFGSSSRGGAAALRALAGALRAGDDVVVAPDGPRGPRHRVQPGLPALAAMTGVPVVPIAFAAYPARQLATWDGFVVPAPFARSALVIGAPLVIARDEVRDAARLRVEQAIEAVTAAADATVRA
jgi:lysophospholipid acyltransferase (LPLAT)-like uncharacterized protein